MTNKTVAVGRATYDAYVKKDRAAIEALIASDFHFTSPLDNRINRVTYFERCWPNSAAIEGFEFIRFVSEGEQLYVTYEGLAAGRRFRNTEILTIKNGQVTDVEVYFGWSIPHPAPSGGFVQESS